MRRSIELTCVLLAACASDATQPERSPSVAAAAEALSANVHELPMLTWDELSITGRDAGYSARIGSTSAWVFGDTFNQVPAADGSFLSNTWSWTQDVRADDGIGPFQQATDANGAPLQLLPYDPAGWEIAYNDLHECTDDAVPCTCQANDDECGDRFALWPGPVVTYTDNDEVERALVLYTELYVGRADYDYRVRGTSIARWDDLRGQATRTPTAVFGPEHPAMTAGALRYTARGVEYLYVYTCAPGAVLTADCRVGRAPFARGEDEDALDAILDRASWRFYVGGDPDSASSWSTDPDDAVVVMTANTTLSVQPNAYLEQLTAVYAQFLTNDVYLQTAPRPEGPWSGHASEPLFDVGPIERQADYYAIVHPEFDVASGKQVYITTSHPDGTNLFRMPTRLFEVTLNK